MVTLSPELTLDAAGAVAGLREGGVLAGSMGPRLVRLVTHADVGDADVERCSRAFAEVSRAASR